MQNDNIDQRDKRRKRQKVQHEQTTDSDIKRRQCLLQVTTQEKKKDIN